MKKIFLLMAVALGFASCSPVVHKSITKPMVPQESTATVAVFEVNEMIPKNAEIIGEIVIKDSGFTTDCDWETILERAKTEVRAAGGNGLEILQHTYPNRFSGSSCHQIQANILHIGDDIQLTELSEKAIEHFHDYVILKEGDTTQCNIIDETKNYLTFIYEGQGVARQAMLPKDKIISYHIDDPVALSELQSQRNKKLFTVRFGLEGGYAFRTAKISDGYSSDYKDYIRKLSRGPLLGANVLFNIDNTYSIGVHYDRFMSSNSAYFYAYDNNGIYHEGIVSNNIAINFIAVSAGYFTTFNQKHRLFAEYLLGYMDYTDEGVEFDQPQNTKGGTLGMGVAVDYDYMLSEHFGVGAGVSYFNGALSRMNINGTVQDLVNAKEGLQRINFKAGIRYYF